ncbi:MAG: VWA domain-containing protein [Bacteroidetes bacterium]|nr:VWA domain-containing protein [Bacteroidota bacterium]
MDNTSSMMDEIEQTKANIDKIINKFSRFKNIKMSVVTYGDINVDGKNWYTSVGLTDDYSQITNFIKKIELIDGGDYPESVNDAIYRTILETKWTEGSNKMILVIGDAPSHKKPYSRVELDDIFRLCKSKKIVINFYPIIIAIDITHRAGNEVSEDVSAEVNHFINKLTMNYSRESCRIDLKYGSTFKVELFTIKGQKLTEAKFFGSKYDLNVSNYPNGNYVVRIIDEQNNQLDGQFFDIAR